MLKDFCLGYDVHNKDLQVLCNAHGLNHETATKGLKNLLLFIADIFSKNGAKLGEIFSNNEIQPTIRQETSIFHSTTRSSLSHQWLHMHHSSQATHTECTTKTSC